MEKKKILLFADWYEPGFKAGGPIRSCVNFTHRMKRYYEIYVFTSDRDLGSPEPYENIGTDKWVKQEDGVAIFYCSPSRISFGNIKAQITHIQPDFIYLNSMFSKGFTIYPLLAGARAGHQAKMILSPRGMLRDSALRFKPFKKKIFLSLIRWTGFHRRLYFHASDETEQNDIHLHFGKNAKVAWIANLPGIPSDAPVNSIKRPGELCMVFIGRIHPIKNLDYLLERLKKIPGPVKLSIIGSREDKVFWEKCQDTIRSLPSLITVEYLGEMPNHEIPAILRKHHIFVLPTRGENFGHAIFEALCLKKPVLISDQTPWRDLNPARAGWDVPLSDPEGFERAIREAISWGQEEYDRWSQSAFDFANKYMDKSNAVEKYRQLFS
jgi:glycosyltransferase involved in cell wall biosynthesis